MSRTTILINIIKGLRPAFAEGAPECYIQLEKQCVNADALPWKVFG
ncbi:2703_t:CDS:1, partial [Racocetra fulgida]